MGYTVADCAPPEPGVARLMKSSQHAIRGPARRR